ncbi:MAG: F0F1 ATP synthase subunit A [Blastochloris sp.]|nr:F0F1 ATP synthase subunit A [Blastochloris sp.]
MAAPTLTTVYGFPITNSMVVAAVMAGLIILAAQLATRNLALVPGPAQNFFESIIENLSGVLEGVLGWDLLKKTFWFFASIFIFIFACNLQALMPGVGTIGYGTGSSWYNLEHVTAPWLRGAHADANMTLALALSFFMMWIYWAVKFNGPVGVLKHIFIPNAKLSRGIFFLVLPFFLFVGLIEIVSIMVRPVSLTFRLFGNIYGGEAIIDQIKHTAPNLVVKTGILLPVYAYELLVALVQALVFTLLTAVFTALMCRHEGHDGHHEEEDGKGH